MSIRNLSRRQVIILTVVDKLNECHICNERTGLGIWLVGGYICSSCLEEISNTEVQDPKYDYFIFKLKELWLTG